jgi:hypothetical protein
MHLVVENKCVTSSCIYHSPWLCGHSVGLVFNYDSRVVYSFLHTTKDLGDPGSSRGTLERVRVDLTVYMYTVGFTVNTVIGTEPQLDKWMGQASPINTVSD